MVSASVGMSHFEEDSITHFQSDGKISCSPKGPKYPDITYPLVMHHKQP